ncbi:MAG TPA: hypothetical protein VF546_24335 [Pyrinomonadaceae bacterium]
MRREFFVREGRTIGLVRLRLLALVLALALTWYALNPAPGAVRPVKRAEEPPDEERRVRDGRAGVDIELEPARARVVVARSAARAADVSVEDLEWPEVIDV